MQPNNEPCPSCGSRNETRDGGTLIIRIHADDCPTLRCIREAEDNARELALVTIRAQRETIERLQSNADAVRALFTPRSIRVPTKAEVFAALDGGTADE
jgi:hypothetical protein